MLHDLAQECVTSLLDFRVQGARAAQQAAVQGVHCRDHGGPEEPFLERKAEAGPVLGGGVQVGVYVLVFTRQADLLWSHEDAHFAIQAAQLGPAGEHGDRNGEQQGNDKGELHQKKTRLI